MRYKRTHAEILSTGDEIRRGIIADTNSAYISNILEINGIIVDRHTCVGDDLTILISVIHEISNRTGIAIVSGGLGPTMDDLTSEAAAEAASVRMEFSKRALENVAYFYRKKKTALTRSALKQAFLPEGSECIFNDIGSAPGFSLLINKCVFFFIPGVPDEAKYMITQKIIPKIREKNKNSIISNEVKTLTVFGLSESEIDEKLLGFGEKFPEIKLGICINFPQIKLIFYSKKTSCKKNYFGQKEAIQWIINRIGSNMVSQEGESMGKVVGSMLKIRKATLAVAESCTGGLISDHLTNIPGSSDYFLLSMVTYSNASKISLLGVCPETIEKYGSVHINTAIEMAVGIRKKGNSTYGLSITGIAGPIEDFSKKPVGRVCVGISSSNNSYALKFDSFSNDRLENKIFFATLALDILRKEMLDSLDY